MFVRWCTGDLRRRHIADTHFAIRHDSDPTAYRVLKVSTALRPVLIIMLSVPAAVCVMDDWGEAEVGASKPGDTPSPRRAFM